jgi:hypothetical protein
MGNNVQGLKPGGMRGPDNSYGYVDLLGNHLPCPAMAKEENPGSFLTRKSARLRYNCPER